MFIDRNVFGSNMEKACFDRLCFRLKRFETKRFKPLISIQFSLLSLFPFEEIPKEQIKHWNPHWSSVDFVVYDSEIGVPIAGIEFFGKNFHFSNNTHMRDDFKKDLFKQAEIPLIIYTKTNHYKSDKMFDEVILKYRGKAWEK